MAIRNNLIPLMVERLQGPCRGIPLKDLDMTVATLKQISSPI